MPNFLTSPSEPARRAVSKGCVATHLPPVPPAEESASPRVPERPPEKGPGFCHVSLVLRTPRPLPTGSLRRQVLKFGVSTCCGPSAHGVSNSSKFVLPTIRFSVRLEPNALCLPGIHASKELHFVFVLFFKPFKP